MDRNDQSASALPIGPGKHKVVAMVDDTRMPTIMTQTETKSSFFALQPNHEMDTTE